jgi:hypothetical protein
MTWAQAVVLQAEQRGHPMSTERPEEFSEPSVSRGRQDDLHNDGSRPETTVVVRGETLRDQEPKSAPKESPPQPQQATVVVRGEAVRDQDSKSPNDSPPKDKGKEKSSHKEVSEAKVKMQSRLPALGDDVHVGVQKEHLITRDGKADLTFTGALLASAAPPAAPQGQWKEYRVYETNGGKHVFSKISRSVEAEKQDTHEAEVFDPSPSSVPSKLLKSARELTHARPLTWTDAAVAFFGYDPLAKTLYRKLGGQFDEHIS